MLQIVQKTILFSLVQNYIFYVLQSLRKTVEKTAVFYCGSQNKKQLAITTYAAKTQPQQMCG